MKKIKILGLLFLICALLAASVSGCGTTKEPASVSNASEELSESPQTTSPEPTVAPAPEETSEVAASAPAETVSYPLTEEPVTFTYLQMWDSRSAGSLVTSGSDLNYFQTASELTNVYLEFTDVPRESYRDNVSIIVSSGDYPDMISNLLETNISVNSALEEGIILDLAEMADALAPNFMNVMGRYDDIRKDCYTDDGKLGAFYTIEPGNPDPGATGLFLNEEMLKATGMEYPKTLDEMHDILVAFKNGGAAIPFFIDSYSYPLALFSCFDVDNILGDSRGLPLFQVDGQVTTSMLQDGYVDCVQLLRDWYSEGLINPEFYAGENVGDAVAGGSTGALYGDKYTYSMFQNFGISYVTGTVPTRTEGQTLHMGQNLQAAVQGGTSITSNCSDPELAVQYLDYFYSDEGSMLITFGNEGESYTLDENGDPVMAEMMLSGEDKDSYQYKFMLQNQVGLLDNREFDCRFSAEIKTFVEDWLSNNDNAYYYSEFVTLSAEESDAISAVETDILTHMEETVISVIVGEKTMEDLETMLHTVKEMGLENIMASYQSAYDRYLAR